MVHAGRFSAGARGGAGGGGGGAGGDEGHVLKLPSIPNTKNNDHHHEPFNCVWVHDVLPHQWVWVEPLGPNECLCGW